MSSDDATEQVRRLEDRLRVLSESTRAFAEATDDLDQVLESVAQRVAESVHDACLVLLLSADGKALNLAAAYDPDPGTLRDLRGLFSTPFLLSEHPAGRGVHESGNALFVPHLDLGPSDLGTTAEALALKQRLGLHSLVIVALRVQNESLGQLMLLRNRTDRPAYDAHDVLLAQALADHAALAIGRARSATAEHQARDDAEQARTALRQSEARFSRLSEAGVIGIQVSDLDGKISEINDVLLGMLGYSRDDILAGKVNWRGLTPPEWREVDARAVAQLKESGAAGLREKEYFHRDGRRVPVLAGSAMLGGDSREAISFVLDLAPLKQTQASLEAMRAESATHARYRALLETAPEAMVIVDYLGKLIIVNGQVEKIFGYPRSELIGQNVEMLIPEYFRYPPPRPAGTPRELGGRRRDGTEFPVEMSSSPLESEGGILISSAVRDITERKRAEAALANARDAAEAASRELETFSYTVAHDLRSPLRGMNGFSQLLLDEYGSKFDEEGREWLRAILSNSQRMGELIDALLALSRVSRTELNRDSVDLSAVFRTAVAQLEAQDPDRSVTLVIEEGLRADLDPILTRALLENLVGNAWKFTAQVPAARIELGVTTFAGARAFFVRDNGAGFDMAYASKLFMPFQRLHSTTEFPGTGIGLATVHRIVRRHGGRIWAEGRVGEGATFFFSFPDGSQLAIG